MPFAPSPAARTLSDLRAEISRYVLMPQDNEALDVASSGIKSACAKINRYVWKWAITYDDITFVAGTKEYNLDATIKEPRRLVLRDASSNDIDRLGYLEFQSFLNEYLGATTNSDPCVYSVSNLHSFGTLVLDCAPSSSWVSKYPTGRLWYYKRIEPPSDPSDVVDVPQEVEDFILWHAKGFIASMCDKSKVDVAMRMATDAFRELRADNMTSHDWE